MVRNVRRERRTSLATPQRSLDSRVMSEDFDGHVGAGANGDAEIGLHERRGVVDAVADHGHHASFGLQPADLVELVGGEDLGELRLMLAACCRR